MNPVLEFLLWVWNTSAVLFSAYMGLVMGLGFVIAVVYVVGRGVWAGLCSFGEWLARP